MIISFFGHADFIENEEYKERFMKFLDETVGDKTADFTLFCIKREWGGAHKTYLYTKRKKKNIFNIAEQILNTESFTKSYPVRSRITTTSYPKNKAAIRVTAALFFCLHLVY